jgi:hypothetical protein
MPASRAALCWTRIKDWTMAQDWTMELIRRVSQNTSSSRHASLQDSSASGEVGRDATRYDRPVPQQLSSDRTRMWRRRSLLRKGTRLSSSIGRASVLSVAMLDEDGMVIGWHEPTRDLELADPTILHRHVSELYVAEDKAAGVPARDLLNSTTHGSSTQQGWRRGSDGAMFWAMTVIKAMRLRDGTLQGFSYVTSRKPIPWNVRRPESAQLSRTWFGTET